MPTDSDTGNRSNIFISAARHCFLLSSHLLQCLFLLGNLLSGYYVINHIESKSKGIQKKTPQNNWQRRKGCLNHSSPLEHPSAWSLGTTEPWEVSLPLLDPFLLSSEQSVLIYSYPRHLILRALAQLSEDGNVVGSSCPPEVELSRLSLLCMF